MAIAEKVVKKIVNKILSEAQVRRYKVCIAFLDNKKIRQLNKVFLGCNCPTDVLAFPYQVVKKNKRQIFSADIAISTEMAIRNSKFFKTSVQEELTLYIIHGILHLLGFDDTTKAKKKKIEKEQSHLLNIFKKDIGKICL